MREITILKGVYTLTQRVQIALFNTLATPKTFHMRHTVLLQGEPVKSPNRGQTF